jgi:hypothetical protein
MCVVWVVSCPSQSAIVAMSTPLVRLDFAQVGVADGVALVAFGRDRHDPRDGVRVFGVFQRRVPVERMDRAEPGVAGAGAVAAILLQVSEERSDQRRVQVVDVQLERLFAGLFSGVAMTTFPSLNRCVSSSGAVLWCGIASVIRWWIPIWSSWPGARDRTRCGRWRLPSAN